MPRFRLITFVLAALLALAGCATGVGTRADALDRTIYDYSAAVRWNNFELAFEAIAPEAREKRPLTSFELERMKQSRVVGYTVVSAGPTPDGGVVRDVELRLVNVHTQAERVMRTRETWRYDEAAERWWQEDGLPVFTGER